MTNAEILSMLKVDLGISGDAYDERLGQYIVSAKKNIGIEGITLDADDVHDCNLVIDYAAWLWRKRMNGDGMPRMLRWQLNQRLFHEKLNENEEEVSIWTTSSS